MRVIFKIVVVALVISVFSCDYQHYENYDCEEEIEKNFGECREDIPMDFMLEINLLTEDTSYLDTALWSLIEVKRDSSVAGSLVFSLHGVADSNASVRLVVESEVLFVSMLYLDYANGDIDTLTFTHFGLSGICCNAHYIDDLKINGDSLIRNDEYYYVFNKR